MDPFLRTWLPLLLFVVLWGLILVVMQRRTRPLPRHGGVTYPDPEPAPTEPLDLGLGRPGGFAHTWLIVAGGFTLVGAVLARSLETGFSGAVMLGAAWSQRNWERRTPAITLGPRSVTFRPHPLARACVVRFDEVRAWRYTGPVLAFLTADRGLLRESLATLHPLDRERLVAILVGRLPDRNEALISDADITAMSRSTWLVVGLAIIAVAVFWWYYTAVYG